MRIEKIELCNFGSYEGINTFDTASGSREERIVIVGGKNGAGKTTLFTAIQVCLYGHASFGYKALGKLYLKEIYNLVNANARMDENQVAYVKVVFAETRIDRDQYEVCRTWKWSNERIVEELHVTKNGIAMDEEQTSDFQNYLLHLIPPELLNLYFFDGEKIADYFLNEQHNNVKDALLILSGNDTYEILYNSIRRLLVGSESDAQNIAQDYADQKEAYRVYLQKEQALQNQVQSLASEIDSLELALREENSAYASEGGLSLDEWKALQKKLRDEEERREKLNAELKSYATDNIPFVIVGSLLEKVYEQIAIEKDLQAYQLLQKKLSGRGFKNHMFEVMQTFTNSDITAETDQVLAAIQSYFRNSKLEKSSYLFKLSEDEIASVQKTVTELREFDIQVVANCRSEIDESIERGKVVREQLQKGSIENYEGHVRKVAEITTELERAKIHHEQEQVKLIEIQGDILKVQKALEVTRKALETELKKQSVSALSDRMLLLVEELQEQQYRKLLASVERDLNVKFQQLIRKEGFVDHIYLDSSFDLHLVRNQEVDVSALQNTLSKHGIQGLRNSLKTRGYDALIDLLECDEANLARSLSKHSTGMITLPIELDHHHFSNGEKQILVMALYWALMKQSKSELPFIIDTPFARIDTEHRANITELLFKELNGQLFVLSTNEELRHEHLEALDKQVAKVYMLEYGDDKRTTIIEGSYFEV